MDKMDVLILDGCTHREAEKHLKNGTRVFDSIAEYIECMEADGYSVPEDIEANIKAGKLADVHYIDGHVIEYVL